MDKFAEALLTFSVKLSQWLRPIWASGERLDALSEMREQAWQIV